MPRNPRMYRHGETYFVSNRTARGLPFVPNDFMNLILGGVLARARSLYSGIAVGAWIFMGNHYHGILTLAGCPENMRQFMNYVDAEVAKCVNRLLGVTNQNVWAGEYEARALLTADSVIEKFVYLFCNPAKANLVESINHYPGFSTWAQFLGKPLESYKWIKSSELEQLPRQGFSNSLTRELLGKLDDIERDSITLVLEPFAWMQYLPDASQLTEEQVTQRVIADVHLAEAGCAKERRLKKKGIVTAAALSSQSIYKFYRPKSWTKSTACLSTSQELFKEYLTLYRDFCAACRKAWSEWKIGNLSAKYPPGAFLPWRNPPSSVWI